MNLANRVTLARIFLVPLFLTIVSMKFPYGDYLAAGVFILAASTDGLDGYIARKRKQVTVLGKFMDPLADKLLISAALISLVELGRLSGWVAVLIIGRELTITGLRAIVARDGVVVSSSGLGKIKMITQIVAIVALFLQDYPFDLLQIPLGNIAMTIAVFFTIWSGFDYFRRNWGVLTR
ncbi:MAG: CDP-diacylglycerol--glycerol-3-phosphate 3-phosphatidyltransferase [Bacillota bacterium]|jgi:CDP-diacylglycerol--glycerol-3-phosphate 3-phosphatidyltransferase